MGFAPLNAATGIDIAEDDGWSGAAFEFLRIQGADACGEIVVAGENVDPTRAGERVLVEPVLRGESQFDIRYLGSENDGAFNDYVCVPTPNAFSVHSPLRLMSGIKGLSFRLITEIGTKGLVLQPGRKLHVPPTFDM